MGRRTQVEIATDTLRNLLAHLEALAEMGVSLPIPAELADSCRKIARLAGDPVAEIPVAGDSVGREKVTALAKKVTEVAEPSLNSEVSTPRAATEAAHLKAVADVATKEPEGPPRPTIRDTILTVIQPGEDVTVGEVVDRLETTGIAANRDTVSNELSRWTHEGVLERPARGIYRMITSHPDEDHRPLAAEERPDEEEGMSGDAAVEGEGAVM